jgi:hypothetical protein
VGGQQGLSKFGLSIFNMSFKKFNKHSGGKYWERYFQKSEDFYRTIQNHLEENLAGRSTNGLDIGAGPGVGARLLADAELVTRLVGYEPSETHQDGKKLAEQLARDGSVNYVPKKGGIEDIAEVDILDIDYMLILRACHEIADSVGGKDQFFSKMHELLGNISDGDLVFIGEPQYNQEITDNPQNYPAIIDEVMAFQERVIGHSHVPNDYVTYQELEGRFSESGLTLLRRDILPHQGILNHVRSVGFDVKESPCLFFVDTYGREG